jgi:acyl-coenzyme A thioesterase PaaI-like protein
MKTNKISPFLFRWMMNLYPPFLFGRVRIKKVSSDFKHIEVCVRSSVFNKNLSGTLFGGTMFSAADPFYALMYWQNFAHQYKQKVRVWLKAADIKYKRPANKDMYLDFKLTQADIEQAKHALEILGKFNKEHEVELRDKQGNVYASVRLIVFVGLP